MAGKALISRFVACQTAMRFDRLMTEKIISDCAKKHFEEDEDETEETIC